MWTRFVVFSLCVSVFLVRVLVAADENVAGYPIGVRAVTYVSSADETEQRTLFWKPDDQARPAPLLVALHTWSGGYDQAGGQAAYARWCQQVGWVFVHPDFRGRNRRPEAMGSDLVVADILSAVAFAKANANVDADRVYLMGGSGGGHASLLMAGRAPEVWAGVSAWCGISDIAAWHLECAGNERFARYAREIEQALGGRPAETKERVQDAHKRSPIAWLTEDTDVAIDLNHGIEDGRAGSVPFTHSLRAWNCLVDDDVRFSGDAIREMYDTQNVDPVFDGVDLLYGERKPLFRRTAGRVRLTLFDGGHEIIHNAGLNWLAAQRRGQPAVWDVDTTYDFAATETASGK